MNQSIEDASLSLDDLRHHTEVGTGLSKDAMLNRAADEIEQLRAQLREARQSSQSEPVAKIVSLDGKKGIEFQGDWCKYEDGTKLYAAPQQAIASGLSDDTIHELIQKYHPKCIKGVKTKFEVTDWWRFAKAIEKALSASPTAPIESDK
jgi:hypothetical protein